MEGAELTGGPERVVAYAARRAFHEVIVPGYRESSSFDSGGCTIELRPAAHYGATRAATFAQIVATASNRGETAFGYRVAASGTVQVNPDKQDPLNFGDDDQVLVLASWADRSWADRA